MKKIRRSGKNKSGSPVTDNRVKREVEFGDEESSFANPLVGKSLQIAAKTDGENQNETQNSGHEGSAKSVTPDQPLSPRAPAEAEVDSSKPQSMRKPATGSKHQRRNGTGAPQRARQRRYSQAVQSKVKASKWSSTGEAINAAEEAARAIAEADREQGVGRNEDGSAPAGFFKLDPGTATSEADGAVVPNKSSRLISIRVDPAAAKGNAGSDNSKTTKQIPLETAANAQVQRQAEPITAIVVGIAIASFIFGLLAGTTFGGC